MASRPGIITVRSRPSSPLLTPIVFQKWYEDVHIPDVLATGYVKSAARYYIANTQNNQCESSMPFLAIYHLPDMNWLHEVGCQFWKIPVHSEILPGDNASIFDVAEFETSFYEMIDTVQFRMGADGSGHVAPKLLLSCFDLAQECSGDPRSVHKAALGWLGMKESEISSSVRSALFKVDQTRPHHPAMQASVGEPREKQYLCMLEYSGDPHLEVNHDGDERLKYTLLRAFGSDCL